MSLPIEVEAARPDGGVKTVDTIKSFDVIVVGAGPAGSTAAEHLARAGLRVALLEEHTQVGVPVHCSGLVSPRALDTAGVSEETVALRSYRAARIWGPGVAPCGCARTGCRRSPSTARALTRRWPGGPWKLAPS